MGYDRILVIEIENHIFSNNGYVNHSNSLPSDLYISKQLLAQRTNLNQKGEFKVKLSFKVLSMTLGMRSL